jgi:hypothetical protein
MKTISSKCLVTLCVLIGYYVIVSGQSLESSLKGAVLDQMGARVARAKIRVKSKVIECELESDEMGNFSVHLPQGTYQIVIESPGFKVAKLSKVRVDESVSEIEVILKVKELKYGKCPRGKICLWL